MEVPPIPALTADELDATADELDGPVFPAEQVPDRLRQEWVSTYLAACKEHRVKPSADVVTCFKLGLGFLKLYRFSGVAPFVELDLQPITETFDRHPAALERLKTLNFVNAKLGPSGTITVADWLSRDNCKVETLHFARQLPGAAGLDALVGAVRSNANLKKLNLAGCHLGDKGSAKVAVLLEEGLSAHGLSVLDLENNGISFDMLQRFAAIKEKPAEMNLEGNQVFDEILNAISHGIGVVLAIVGTVFMALAVSDKPGKFVVAVVVYSVCLHTLYLSSTLFHSFLSLGSRVREVVSVLDHAAIYLLIVGSFCPFVLVHLEHAYWILYAQLAASAVGIGTAAFYYGPGKTFIETTLYLLMGWSALIYIPDLSAALGPTGTNLLVLGGVLYTLGVPFFARSKRILGVPDHTIWHFFVLGGSVAHFFCIYWYCFACVQGRLSVSSSCPCLEGVTNEWCIAELPLTA